MVIRPLTFLTALALAAPLPVLAQTYPASAAVAMGVRDLQPADQAVAMNDPTIQPLATAERPAAEALPAASPQPVRLKARNMLDHDSTPTVDIRAKDEWSDNQGLRFNYTNVSFKQRF